MSVDTASTATAFTDSGLTNGTTYYYIVGAYNGTTRGPNSNTATGTPIGTPNAATNLVIDAPTAGGQLTLHWSAPSTGVYPTDYMLFRATNSSFSGAVTVDTNSTGMVFTDTGLTNGTTYYYIVGAYCGATRGPNSNTATATPTNIPNAPTNLTIAAPTVAGQLTLNWSAPAGGVAPTRYIVFRANNPGLSSATALNTASTVTSYVDTGLTVGATYYYAVASCNVNTQSASNTNVVGAIVAGVPATPTNLTATTDLIPAGGQVTLHWLQPTSGAVPTHYLIRRSNSPDMSSPVSIDTGNTATTYVISGLPSPGIFYFTVQALVGSTWQSDYPSNVAAGASSDTIVMKNPVGTRPVTVAWYPVTGATSYKIYRNLDGIGIPAYIGTSTTTSYLDSAAYPFRSFGYYVSALVGSTEVSRSTGFGVVPLPANLIGSGLNGPSNIVYDWNTAWLDYEAYGTPLPSALDYWVGRNSWGATQTQVTPSDNWRIVGVVHLINGDGSGDNYYSRMAFTHMIYGNIKVVSGPDCDICLGGAVPLTGPPYNNIVTNYPIITTISLSPTNFLAPFAGNQTNAYNQYLEANVSNSQEGALVIPILARSRSTDTYYNPVSVVEVDDLEAYGSQHLETVIW